MGVVLTESLSRPAAHLVTNASIGRPAGTQQTVLALGKYELRREIGRGAMGIVHEGWDPIIARRLAIKTVRLPATFDAESRDAIGRFRREAQAGGRLTHPNIVSVFDYGETDDMAYIVMEYIDGPSVKSLLENGSNFTLSDTLRIMKDLLAGLQFSHDYGVVHRDVKPANIILTCTGQAKIADFGAARIECSSMTQDGTVIGTPAYMSPEQFIGQVVDARSDVYSAGVLFYELLTGHRLFVGTASAVMQKVLNTDPPAPSELTPTVSCAFDAVVHQAMAKDPERRYQSAAAFATAIERAAGQTEPAYQADATRVSNERQACSAIPAMAVVPKPPNADLSGRKQGRLKIVAAAAAAGCVMLASGVAWWLPQRQVQYWSGNEYELTTTNTLAQQPVGIKSAEIPSPVNVPDQTRLIGQMTTRPDPSAGEPPAPSVASQIPDPAVSSATDEIPMAVPRAQDQRLTGSATLPATIAQQPLPAPTPSQDPDAEPWHDGPKDAPAALRTEEALGQDALMAMLAPSDTPNAIPDSNNSSTQLLLARRKAQYLPCSMLALADKPDGLHVSGPAQAGPELDRILGELRGLSHLTDRIIRIGRFACAPIAALVRQSWESTPSLPFAIQLDQRKIIGGSRIGIDVTTTLPAVYIDLYQKDGSVRHLQVTSRSAAKTSATWVTSQPTGSLLVTAIGSERLLDIGTRPEVEPAARYLEVLQAELKRTTTRIQSDLVAVPPQAPLPLAAAQPYKCANTATNPESDGGFLSSVKQMFGLGQSGTIKIVNPQVKASVAAHSRATAACGSPGDHKSSR